MYKYICYIFFVFTFSGLKAQSDKLFMMNGKILDGRITAIGQDSIRWVPKGKQKDIFIEKYRVFSVQYEEGKRQILYTQDSLNGRDYTLREMELLVMGGQDALNNHKTYFPFALATAMGGTGGYVLSNSFLVFGVPMFTMLGTAAITQPIINRSAVRKAVLLKDENYRKGYKRVLRVKRNNQAIFGSVVGTVAGFVVATLTN